MLQREDGIETQSYFHSRRDCEFLGFLPICDDALTYYSVQNIGTNTEYERVTPVFGEYNNEIQTEIESWFQNPFKGKGREEDRLRHEYYRDEFLKRFEECKYCVWFLGCDDADYFMRFKTKEDALQYLTSVDFFDEVYENEQSMMW